MAGEKYEVCNLFFSDGRHCDRSLRVRSGKLDLRAGLWRFVLFGLHDAASDPVDRRYPPGWIYGHIGCSGVLRGPGKKAGDLKRFPYRGICGSGTLHLSALESCDVE